jgi:hypothetical protein
VLICTTAYCVMTLPHSSACPETQQSHMRTTFPSLVFRSIRKCYK